jgi:hypothetical protein
LSLVKSARSGSAEALDADAVVASAVGAAAVVGVVAAGTCVAVDDGAEVGEGNPAGGSSELHATAARANKPISARNIVMRRDVNIKIKSSETSESTPGETEKIAAAHPAIVSSMRPRTKRRCLVR